MSSPKPSIKYVFDLYSVIRIINNGSNQLRSFFIDGMKDGSIKVLKSLSKELKDVDPDAYDEFQGMKPSRVYVEETIADEGIQGILMTKYGTSIFGGSPSPSSFMIVAVAMSQKAKLVAHGKALKQCQNIINKCNLKSPKVLSLSDFELDCILN